MGFDFLTYLFVTKTYYNEIILTTDEFSIMIIERYTQASQRTNSLPWNFTNYFHPP